MCGYCTELLALQLAWVDSYGGPARVQAEQPSALLDGLQPVVYPAFHLQEVTDFATALQQYLDSGGEGTGHSITLHCRLMLAHLHNDTGVLNAPALRARLNRCLPETAACDGLPAPMQRLCQPAVLLDARRWQQAMQAVEAWTSPCAAVLQQSLVRGFARPHGQTEDDEVAPGAWLPAAFLAATVSLRQGRNTALLDALVCTWPCSLPDFDSPELWLQRHVVAGRTRLEGPAPCHGWIRAGLRPNLLLHAVTRNRWGMAVRRELADTLERESPLAAPETEDAIAWLRDGSTILPGILCVT